MGLRKPLILRRLIHRFNLYRLGKLSWLGHAAERRKVHLPEADEFNFSGCEADHTKQASYSGIRIIVFRFLVTADRGLFRESHFFFSFSQDDLVGQTSL